MQKNKIQSALSAFQQAVAEARAQHTATLETIAKIKAEIRRLQDMPVSRADFSLLLKEHIAAQAESTGKGFARDLLEVKRNFNDKNIIERPAFNKRGMAQLEVIRYGGRPDWLFSYNRVSSPSGGLLAAGNLEGGKLQSLLCWLLPDVVHDRIMQAVDDTIGGTWGNEGLPSVAERRERIADLQAELADLETTKAELAAVLQQSEHSAATASETQRLFSVNNA